jgi:Uma2 family endonuclease
MASPAKRRATYADLIDVPENLVAEIVAGELVVSPRPASRHARSTSRLGASLDAPFDRGLGGPGGWIILDEPELHLGGDALIPDLAGWRRERMPELPDVAAFELAPDWICEVLSPSTEAHDRAAKMPAYAREGVSWAWLVNPLTQTVEVFRLHDMAWMLLKTFRGSGAEAMPPFDAVPLELALLWER